MEAAGAAASRVTRSLGDIVVARTLEEVWASPLVARPPQPGGAVGPEWRPAAAAVEDREEVRDGIRLDVVDGAVGGAARRGARGAWGRGGRRASSWQEDGTRD
eukprot:SAG31_NODE_1590_length_7805_cov_3.417390_3_plen_103_part_00